jgi:FkbM family methyltransferase
VPGGADRITGAAASAVGRWNKPRPYRARYGLARGMKQIGGIRLILPGFLQPAPEYPQYAGVEEAFLRSLDYDGLTIYDIGAFQGEMTLFFADQVGDRGTVIAFEPHPGNYQRVLDNVCLNDFSNVVVRNVGVGGTRGELELVAPGGGGLAGRASGAGTIRDELESEGIEAETFTVPVVSLDGEIRDGSLPDPNFVKIDVEGLELDVLEGMRETIDRCKPRLFVEIHGLGLDGKRANAARVVEFLAACGYSMRHVESDQAVERSTSERAADGHIYCT